MAKIVCGAIDIGTTSGCSTSGFRFSGKEETRFGSIYDCTTSGIGGMVSTIEWIMTMGSYEDFVSTTVDELGCVETI